jgi:hypothetical protein
MGIHHIPSQSLETEVIPEEHPMLSLRAQPSWEAFRSIVCVKFPETLKNISLCCWIGCADCSRALCLRPLNVR